MSARRKLMTNRNAESYAEIDEILTFLDKEYVNRIPKNIRDFFKEQKDLSYSSKIDTKIPLIEQNLKKETIIILAILNLKYWCNNATERQEWINELTENEREKQKLEEKFNSDELFKKSKLNNLMTEKMELIEYKEENIFQKIFNKIRKFIKK